MHHLLRHPFLFILCIMSSVLLLVKSVFAHPSLNAWHFTTLQDRPIAISHWRGKVIVVNFWASWCGPCREELPMLNTFRHSLTEQGGEVIGVALENKADANNYVKKWNIRYPILIGNGETLDLLRELGNETQGLPFTLVIDRQGKIVAKLVGKLSEKTLKDTVKRYL